MNQSAGISFADSVLEMDWRLVSHEVLLISFLCSGIIHDSNSAPLTSCVDIFQRLKAQHVPGQKIKNIFQEALHRIGRLDVLKWFCKVSGHDFKPPTVNTSNFTVFRLLLLNLSESISTEDGNTLRSLAKPYLLPEQVDSSTPILDVFILLEKKGILKDTDISFLYTVDDKIGNTLRKQLINYKEVYFHRTTCNQEVNKDTDVICLPCATKQEQEIPTIIEQYSSKSLPSSLANEVDSRLPSESSAWSVPDEILHEKCKKSVKKNERTPTRSPGSSSDTGTLTRNAPMIARCTGTGNATHNSPPSSTSQLLPISLNREASSVPSSRNSPQSCTSQQLLSSLNGKAITVPSSRNSPPSSTILQSDLNRAREANTVPSSRMCSIGGRATPTSLDMQCYKMDASPRGHCVIISNETFHYAEWSDIQLKDRTGSHFDIENLTNTFTKLDFIIRVYQEQTSQQIIRLMKKYSQHTNHSAYDCIVVVFLSHGSHGSIYGVDSEPVAIADITRLFRASNCSSLAGKPKLFFVGACQGSARQLGTYADDNARYIPSDHMYTAVDVDAVLEIASDRIYLETEDLDVDASCACGDDCDAVLPDLSLSSVHFTNMIDLHSNTSRPHSVPLHVLETHTLEVDSPDESRIAIPDEADFLIGFASAPGYVSYRSRIQGTWYITKLTELLERYAGRQDLLSILVKVNQEVAEAVAIIGDEQYKQIPAPFVTLRKKIYFH